MYIHNPSRLERKNHGRWRKSTGAAGARLAQRPACDAGRRSCRASASSSTARRGARRRIVYAGPEAELPAAATAGAEIIDCEGRWITPGLIDCHTHLVHAGNRAHEFELRLAGATYEEVARAGGGIVSSVKATRAASEDELVRSRCRGSTR